VHVQPQPQTRPQVMKLLTGHIPYTEMCSGTEAGSYLRLIDSCITQLKDQGPSRTCNESKEEEEEEEIICCARADADAASGYEAPDGKT